MAIPPGSKWSCLLFSSVFQDALSEVTRILRSLMLKGFCGGHHSSLEREEQGVGGVGGGSVEKVEERSRGEGFEAVDY